MGPVIIHLALRTKMAPIQMETHSCQYCHCFGIDLRTPSRVNSVDVSFRSPWVSVAQLRHADRHGCLFCATILSQISWTPRISKSQANGKYIIHFISSDRAATHNRADAFGLAIKKEDWPSRSAKLRDLPDTVLFSEGVKVALSFAFGSEHNDHINISVHKDDSLECLSIVRRNLPIFAQEGLSSSRFSFEGRG